MPASTLRPALGTRRAYRLTRFTPRPVGSQRDLYFAEDGLHPSSAAYQYCYDILKRRTRLTRLLAAAGAPRVAAGLLLADLEEHGLLLNRNDSRQSLPHPAERPGPVSAPCVP